MHVIGTTDLLPPDWGFLRDVAHGMGLSWTTCPNCRAIGWNG